MFRSILGIAAVLLSLVLGACDYDTTDDSEQGQAEDGTFSSRDTLKAAAVKAGYDCPSWGDTYDSLKGGTKSVECSNGDAFVWFSEGSFRSAYQFDVRQHNRDFPDDKWMVLIGPNWAIASDRAQELQDALGGNLVR